MILERQSTLWFIFQNEEILLHITSEAAQIPSVLDNSVINLTIKQQVDLGMQGDHQCYAVYVETSTATSLPPEMQFQPIRQAYFTLNDENIFLIASKAIQLLYWDRRTTYCGACGQKTICSEIERAKICTACNALYFPSISPSILALVWRDNEILLGRSPNFVSGVYSILAGFVEPGETLEDCIQREVQEEVGVTVKNIRYFGSQPWPFPSSLMIGFCAECDNGELQVNKNELEDAQWFSLEKLPSLPNQMSLSRRMIDAFVASKKSISVGNKT